jgi:hypothetical protein
MKSVLKRVVFTILVITLFSACEGLEKNNEPGLETGSLSLSVSMKRQRTMVPDFKMIPDVFIVYGEGPGDETCNKIIRAQEDGNVEDIAIENLLAGVWRIKGEALNADGKTIGQGTSEITIYPDFVSSLSITVLPLEGKGNMSLTIVWDPGVVISIDAVLEGMNGHDISFNFPDAANSGMETASINGLKTGYYTLIVKISVDDILKTTIGPQRSVQQAGHVEFVRILDGQTTSGLLDFGDLTGNITTDITFDPQNPLEIILYGEQDIYKIGDSMHVKAEVQDEDPGDLIYIWYLDGEETGIGQEIDLMTDVPGAHRLSLCAFLKNSSRGGSVTHFFNASYSTGTKMYSLTANANPGGTITPAGTIYESINEPVNFIIRADNGYRINGIIVNDIPLPGIAGLKEYSYSFTKTAEEHAEKEYSHILEAFFESREFTLTLRSSGPGAVENPGNTQIPADTAYHVTALQNQAHTRFLGWSASPAGNVSFGNTQALETTVTLSGNAAVTARFEDVPQYTITWTVYTGNCIPTGLGTMNPQTETLSTTETDTAISTAWRYQCSDSALTFREWLVSGPAVIADRFKPSTTVTRTGAGNVTITTSYYY